MKITQEFIEQGQSGAGGWTREQLKLIGVPWPPKHGWRQQVQGREILEADAQKFVAMRGMTLKRQKRLNREQGRFSYLLLNFDADDRCDALAEKTRTDEKGDLLRRKRVPMKKRERINEFYRKSNPKNCPVIEQTGDGVEVGTCTFYMPDGKTCPRHGDVTKYEASARERLLDLKRSIEAALMFDQSARDAGLEELQRPITQEDLDREGLSPGEFAIGNWIIRPRENKARKE